MLVQQLAGDGEIAAGCGQQFADGLAVGIGVARLQQGVFGGGEVDDFVVLVEEAGAGPPVHAGVAVWNGLEQVCVLVPGGAGERGAA